MFGPCFVIQFLVSWFCNHLDGEERELVALLYLSGVLLLFSGFSSRCRGLVCSV